MFERRDVYECVTLFGATTMVGESERERERESEKRIEQKKWRTEAFSLAIREHSFRVECARRQQSKASSESEGTHRDGEGAVDSNVRARQFAI